MSIGVFLIGKGAMLLYWMKEEKKVSIYASKNTGIILRKYFIFSNKRIA